MKFNIVVTGILCLHTADIINGINDCKHRGSGIHDFFRYFNLAFIRRHDLVDALDLVQLRQYPLVGELWYDSLIDETYEVPFLTDAYLIVAAASVQHIGGQIEPSRKGIHHGHGGVGLEFVEVR